MDRLLTELEVPHDQILFLRFLARISGTRYDEAATVDARQRIVAFFDTHLRAPSSSA